MQLSEKIILLLVTTERKILFKTIATDVKMSIMGKDPTQLSVQGQVQIYSWGGGMDKKRNEEISG